jgi:hypothetical protein
MKLKLSLIFIVALLCLTFVKANAQTDTSKFTPAHLQAAGKFLIATGINTEFTTIINNLIPAFAKNLPEDKRAAFTEVMRKFMTKYYTWDLLKDQFSKTYAAEFSESELVQLTDFYNTPIGKKYSEKRPALAQKGMLIGQQMVAQHQPELIQMMQDALKTK